ncbi:hypothetical protein ABW636_22460 [Aquimarina sp. 2201CG1-2-11]|uniref:hypothetical protein n=1 Tax=Aquimarina discodermiae TaxID=3231043 RepID=UPI003462E9F8
MRTKWVTLLINSPQYLQSKVYRLQNVVDSIKISGDIFPSKIANGILSVLDAEDFQLEYYKIKTFVLLDGTNTTSKLSQKLKQKKEKFKKLDLDNAIKIHVTKKNETLVDNKNVSILKMRELIREYVFKSKSNSIISLTSSKETIYKVYVDVQNTILNEIDLLRKQLSLKKYGIEYSQLTKVQRLEIENIYPKKLIEGY